jgi:hypothetical protein
MGVDLDVVVGCFEVVDVFDRDDLDLSRGFDDDALLLGGGFGGGVEEGLLGAGRLWNGRDSRFVLIHPFAKRSVEALFGEGFEEVVDGVGLECADGIFIVGGGEDDGGRVFDELEHFESVDLWHLDIEEDEVGVVLLDRLKSFKSVVAFLKDGDIGVDCKYSFTISRARGSSSIRMAVMGCEEDVVVDMVMVFELS